MEENNFNSINLALEGPNLPQIWGIKSYRWIHETRTILISHNQQPPDPTLPTAISLNYLNSARIHYPQWYNAEPDEIHNSIVYYYPRLSSK